MARRSALTPTDLATRAAAVLAALVAMVLLVVVATPLADTDALRPLHGPVQVEASHRGQPLGPVVLDLPGQLVHGGLPSDARVIARWTITIDEPEPAGWGVWIERPLYASRLYWDGTLVGETADPATTRRSEVSLLASLPAARPGTHELTLDLQGDYGKGGVVGRIVHGPLPQVWRLATRVEAEKFALVLLLASLALLHLTLAGAKQRRWVYTSFGLLCLALGLYIFLRTDLAFQLVDDAAAPIRLRRAVTAWLGPLGLTVAASFERNNPPSWALGLLAGAVTASLASFLLPMDWLPVLEALFDGLLVACALAFAVVILPMARRGVAGASLLALSTMLPLAWGTISEVLVTNGLIAGGSHLMPTVAGLAIGMTAALMARDAASSERLDRLVRSSADALVRVERDGRILDTNPAADALLGARARGRSLLDWIVSDDQVLARAHLSAGERRPERAEIRLRGEGRIVESVAAELDDRTLLLVLRDVTRRRQIDHGLLQAARMETLGVLVGGLAHDFNNLLGTLLAHVGVLQGMPGTTGAVRSRLERMEATIERASQLTRGLSALTRGTSSMMEPASLAPIVRAAVERVRSSWPERAELHVDVPDGLPRVAAAPTDLEQAVVNLLVNARDAAGLTGVVRVIARPFGTSEGARGVVLAVEDDGPGVPPELRDQIFAPFFTTKEQREGVGLGLAVAKQIAREHHGRIWLEDRPGRGARFCLALHDASVLDAPIDAPGAGRLVFLVDDEAPLRETWSGALRARGYEVEAFGDGTAAANALSARRPDALVTDVLLPGMNGLQLATLCRALHPDVPVLVVSGFIPDDTLPPDARIVRLDKPIRTSRLLAALSRAIAGGEPTGGQGFGASLPDLEAVTWESTRWGTPQLPPRRPDAPPPIAEATTADADDEATGAFKPEA
jgi:PAS domain S-box-containing protein